jgi:hypothetical protein
MAESILSQSMQMGQQKRLWMWESFRMWYRSNSSWKRASTESGGGSMGVRELARVLEASVGLAQKVAPGVWVGGRRLGLGGGAVVGEGGGA